MWPPPAGVARRHASPDTTPPRSLNACTLHTADRHASGYVRKRQRGMRLTVVLVGNGVGLHLKAHDASQVSLHILQPVV